MKTIKTLIKDFLANLHLSNPKPINYERETEKVPGDSGMVAPPAPENRAILQEDRSRDSDRGGDGSRDNEPVGGESTGFGTEGVNTPSSDEPEEASRPKDEAILEAFRKGVIEGRNQQIEERFFPKTDEEIPRFHGHPSKYLPSDDIFSLAREA